MLNATGGHRYSAGTTKDITLLGLTANEKTGIPKGSPGTVQ
jgi:hypothetical protein